MAVISREVLDFMAEVRTQHPEAWKWAQDKAKWEHMPMGAVFRSYREHIEAMIERKVDSI